MWDNRLLSTGFRVRSTGKSCFVSIDRTDCKIYEQFPFDPQWYSHKFRGPGVRYEVGIAISTGFIVWVFGPFPCGSHPDVSIFRLRMKTRLLKNECVVADKGYQDTSFVHDGIVHRQSDTFSSFFNRNNTSFGALIRARHETAYRRMKQFLF